MGFLLFEKGIVGGKVKIRPTGAVFSLAGYNLLYRSWLAQGSPVDKGWHTSAGELIRILSDQAHSYETRRLIIDFDPKATWRIGIVELLDVYAYTWGDGKGGPSWTPLMFRLRNVFYEEYDAPIDEARKTQILSELDEPDSDTEDFVEFLYLNGPAYGWNWGKNGMTNSAFLEGAARDYFRRFF
jgi:hypothetical protein